MTLVGVALVPNLHRILDDNPFFPPLASRSLASLWTGYMYLDRLRIALPCFALPYLTHQRYDDLVLLLLLLLICSLRFEL